MSEPFFIYVKPYWNLNGEFQDLFAEVQKIYVKPYWNLNSLYAS